MTSPTQRSMEDEVERRSLAPKGELAIHNQFSAWLRKEGIPFIHCDPTRKATIQPGWPDFTVILNGRCALVEVKTPTGKLSQEQVACHAALSNTGTTVVVARSFEECVHAVTPLVDAVSEPSPRSYYNAAKDGPLRLMNWRGIDHVVAATKGGWTLVRTATVHDMTLPRV